METLVHDLRYAIRSLARSASFATLTILTLGLGIGVITALFAVVQAVLLAPIATEHDRLVRVWMNDAARGFERVSLSYPEFTHWREHSRSFDGLAAIQYADATTIGLRVADEALPANVAPVSPGFFDVVHGRPPLFGRWFDAADDQPGSPLVAVVSHRFFQRAAGGDPSFVGRQIIATSAVGSLRIVGVAPAEFDYPLGTDVWVPIGRFFDGREGRFDSTRHLLKHFEVVGRLTRDATIEQAHAELVVLDQQLVKQFPKDYWPLGIVVQPLINTVVGNGRQILLFLFGAAALVFVIAGVNVGALLLMRAAARKREIAVRIALGASFARLVRQTITEALLLGGLGATAGVLVAATFLRLIQWLPHGQVPRLDEATLDSSVLGFSIVMALGWVLALGTTPIWQHTRLTGRTDRGPSELTLRGMRGTHGLRIFTIAEIAAAVIVAIGAGLLVRSFIQLQRVDRGFDAQNVAVVEMEVPGSRYPDAKTRLAFFRQLLPKIAALPGVTAASAVHLSPGTGNVGLSAGMIFEGQTAEDAATNPWATWEPVLPSYFTAMGVPIVAGRAFTDADGSEQQAVAIVSESVARRYWPDQNPIGKRLQFGTKSPQAIVVGVAAETRYRELTRNWMTVYFPADQFFFFNPHSLVVRTSGAPESLLPAIRQTIRNQEPEVAFESLETMEALLARELSRPRTALTVTAVFALIAIVLSAIGVYGVMSYEVRQRWQELAVRSALGATPAQLFRDVTRRSLALAGVGIVIGLIVALGAAGSVRSLLFEVDPGDPMSYSIGILLLLTVVMVASMVPARRAATADPVATLRMD